MCLEKINLLKTIIILVRTGPWGIEDLGSSISTSQLKSKATPSSWPCSSVWSVPLLLRLTLFPSFPQRMSSFQLNLNPLKEPLGFIKVLEWVSAACAGEAGNRVAAPAPVPAPLPAPSARRLGALGTEAQPAPHGPRSRVCPRGRAWTGLDARGGEERPRPGPARGGDAAVGVESRVPRLPPSQAEPPTPTPTHTHTHPEALVWVSSGEWGFKFLFGFTAFRKGRENFLLRSNRSPAGWSRAQASRRCLCASSRRGQSVHFCPLRTQKLVCLLQVTWRALGS